MTDRAITNGTRSPPGPGPTVTAVVTMRGITKSFSGNKVLDDVSLDIRPGEIHGLLGHNGSGKSTLIKILSGVYEPDEGEIAISGRRLSLPLLPDDEGRNGFTFVYQGLGLADDLTVLENLAVVDYHRGFAGQISWRRHAQEAVEMFARFGVDVDLEARIGELEPVMQAVIAITRALDSLRNASGARLFVLDETTTYLPRDRIETLFETVKGLAAEGDGILFVSHRLNEVMDLTDRVSVLREGRLVATANTSDVTERDLIRMIVGRDLEHVDVTRETGRDKAAVTVHDLATPRLHGVTFSVMQGEVLGITGIEGSGFADIPYSLFGAKNNVSGFLEFGNSRLDISSLTETAAMNQGIALVPEDRARLGIASDLSICENMSLLALSGFVRHSLLSSRDEISYVRKLVQKFNVRFSDLTEPIRQLSGGNQQLCLLAKWLGTDPKLLLLHQPTQGVDIGRRFEIWQHLRSAAESGVGVLVASESAEELTELCDRVLVVCDGRITGELVGDAVEKDKIIELTLAVSSSALRDVVAAQGLAT